jgi:hypothetical protein
MIFQEPIGQFYTDHKYKHYPGGTTWGDFDWTTDACTGVDDRPFGWDCEFFFFFPSFFLHG